MSYILDALKRADAERERGVVPGLYARQLAGSGASTHSSARKRILIAAGAALLLGAIALWLWRPASESAPRVAPEQTSAKPAPVPPAVPAPAPLVRPPEVLASAQTTVQQPAPAVAAIPATTATASPTPKTTASAPPAATTTPLLADLAEDIRRQIPALTITGTVYSDNPGQRLLLVNNQVLPQGSLAAPEVTLEEIGAKSSTFSFRGNRFRLQH
ncbi:MAG: general secretion pathway protein GspB [Burkholderiales bacterium]|nr:general secretion pathway protein GspB [Burkholderiales bacterium]